MLQDARVGDFNGRSLSSLSSSVLEMEPDLPQAGTLRNWCAPSHRLRCSTLYTRCQYLSDQLLDDYLKSSSESVGATSVACRVVAGRGMGRWLVGR